MKLCLSPLQRGGRSAGFTFVECCILIGFLALLIALLLPAYRNAMEKAHQAGCIGSLRRLSVPAKAYQMDHLGYMPIRGASSDPFRTYMHYFRPYISEGEFFLCPKAKRPVEGRSTGSAKSAWNFGKDDYGTYALNYGIAAEQSKWMFRKPMYDLHEFGGPSVIPMFIDATWPGFNGVEGEWTGGRIPLDRHDGACVLFVDGAARWYPLEVLRTLKWTRDYL